MVGIIEQQVWGGMMPEMILVGIQNTNRTRDLTPTKTIFLFLITYHFPPITFSLSNLQSSALKRIKTADILFCPACPRG
jgi:diphthamide synthase subunit DPH2